MNNTVLVESKIRQRLRLTCVLLCVFCLSFIVMLVCFSLIAKQNLNGQTIEVTGELKEVFKSGSNTLTFADGKEYNVVWEEDAIEDWNVYIGKTITLVVSQSTFGNSNPWVFGLIVNDETVVDSSATMATKAAEIKEIQMITTIVTVVLCVATCAIFIWRFNIKQFVERPLAEQFAEFLSMRQPFCPERKKFNIFIYVYCALLIVLLIPTTILMANVETVNDLSTAGIVTLSVFLGLVALGLIAIFIVRIWLIRREIDFYADKLPFDFTDISHVAMRKKYKEELQQEIIKEHELNPDSYADGGNGYDVQFSENGVTLRVPFDDEPIAPPEAEDIFTLEGSDTFNADRKSLSFTYGEMNFEAVAHYRKFSRPMMIVIKSRLTKTDDFPEEFVNDIHIALDSNLLATLNKFNVEVENLQYLLDNKKRLMIENCLRRRKKEK